MIHVLAWACAAVAAGALAWGYLQAEMWRVAVAVLAFAVVWAAGLTWRWGWTAALGLAVSATGAAAGLALGVSPGWMAAASVTGLLAYDLFAFEGRLRRAAPTDDTSILVRRHLAWLVAAVGVGTGLVAAAWHVALPLTFGWAAVLALVAALGIGRLVSRNRGD